MTNEENILDHLDIRSYKSADEEDLALSYLELDEIPNNVPNVFYNSDIADIEDPVNQIISLMCNKDYIYFICKYILNMEMPPYQLAILETLLTHRLPLMVASRGSAKTMLLAVYAYIKMILFPGYKVVGVGASFRQSKHIYEYMADIWRNAPVLRDLAGNNSLMGPKQDVDRCRVMVGSSSTTLIPMGTGEKIRGLRANCVISDEIAAISEEIFNTVIQQFAVVSQNPIDKVKEEAIVNKLKRKGLWTKEMTLLKNSATRGNQIICSGTAYYQFNHFYKTFQTWRRIITSRGDKSRIKDLFDGSNFVEEDLNYKDYAIIRIPYTHLPRGLQDPVILSQAKARMSNVQFLTEICAIFAADSDGFYRRSILEACTTNKPIGVSSGNFVQFSVKKVGDPNKRHIMGVDPAADIDNAAISIIELNEDHRKIVHCWSTNKKKFNEYKKHCKTAGIIVNEDYYKYIAKKIREFMRAFYIENIIMDKHGGGGAIAEALRDKTTFNKDEMPIFEIIEEDTPKECDNEDGLHILKLIAPTSEINAEANHGMLKDFQDKFLLFPRFDTIEIEKNIQIDKNLNSNDFDNYESMALEVEELKNEICSIVVSESSQLGKEVFDVPKIKTSTDRKGKLRKDRFSSLLYANYYARIKDMNKIEPIQYKCVGSSNKLKFAGNSLVGALYSGPGVAKLQNFKKNNWQNYGIGYTSSKSDDY